MRPLSEREIQRNDDTIIQVVSHEQIMMRPDVRPNGQSALSGAQSTFNQTLTAKTFTFNSVFDQTATQSEMMDKSGVAKVIAMAMEGYSTTIFCYGQTGSGKTHTLTGPPHLVSSLRFDAKLRYVISDVIVPGQTEPFFRRARSHLSGVCTPFRQIKGKH